MSTADLSHLISPEEAGTLSGLFYQRVRLTPDLLAYRYHDDVTESWRDLTWRQAGDQVARWQAALASEGLNAGDRVAVIMNNSPEWMMFDQAALANGLVVVPLYTQDRPDNAAYILENAGVKLLCIGNQEHFDSLCPVWKKLDFLKRIISVNSINTSTNPDARLKTAGEWLPDSAELKDYQTDRDSLATIVYTSGTTGKPKGVMLSHYNILWDTYQSLQIVPCKSSELFLSFLPLSHTLERTAGYYLPIMVGAAVAYNRSIPQLAEDLQIVKPTVIISVPRIFERVYNKIQAGLEEKPPIANKLFKLATAIGWQRFEYQQGRASWHPKLLLHPLLHKLVGAKVMEKLGGQMSYAVIGGAPLPAAIAKMFISLGLPMLQGYGLTETSPVISINAVEDNDPESVGLILSGTEVRIGENDELQTRSPSVMLGYWDNEQATRDIIDDDGWLHTGDKARVENNHVYITGRIKEILVLANGEKVPPADMEMAIAMDGLFEQVMVIGDNRPFLSALVVFNPEQWPGFAKGLDLDPDTSEACQSERVRKIILEKIAKQLSSFPGYAQVRQVYCQTEAWSIEDGLITPTLKLKRNRVYAKFESEIDKMYANH